jgi:hypothetical protein
LNRRLLCAASFRGHYIFFMRLLNGMQYGLLQKLERRAAAEADRPDGVKAAVAIEAANV